MLKLLIVISSYEIGGVSAVVKNLLDGLDREKFKIYFLAEKIQPRHYLIPNDVTVVDLGISPKKTPFGKIANLLWHIRRLNKKASSLVPDVIFSLSYNTSCYLLLFGGKFIRQRILLGEYSENFFVKPLKRNFRQLSLRTIYKPLMVFTYRRAARVIAVSHSIGDYLKGLCRLDEDKITVIPTPINLDMVSRSIKEEVNDFIFNQDYIYVSLLSRLSVEKGINYLLEAFAKFKQQRKAKLMLIGEGGHRGYLERMAYSLGASSDVIFMGYKENPFKYIKHTDMFVLPSLYEGFPNVVLEAYACGVPVIATRCAGGIREVISDGTSGILVDPANSDSLYGAMVRLASDSDLRKTLREEGLRRVEEYDLAVKIKDYEEALLSISKQNTN